MPRYDLICKNSHETIDHIKGMNEPYPLCPKCGEQTERLWSASAGIIVDDFPGGYVVRHGLVNPDGSPRTFYSKTEIKRACNELGWKQADDTPGKPYKVHWSGRRTNAAEEA